MRINFYPIRNFDLTGAAGAAGMAALGAAGPAGLVLGGLQTALGIYQAISGGAKADRLQRKRRAFKTPEEILDLAKLDQSRIGTGYEPGVLHYLTGNADNALSSSLNTAKLLGANPNQLNDLLEERFQQNLAIGSGDQLENMKKYSALRESMQILAANDAAEQKSREDLLKDQLQAASATQQQAVPNILGGGNTILNTFSAANTANLFKQMTQPSTMPAVKPGPISPEIFNQVLRQIRNSPITADMLPPGTMGDPSSVTTPATPGTPGAIDMNTLMKLLNQMKIGQ